MDDRHRVEADRLRAVPESLRPWPMASDARWQMACWIHQRPVASLAAWTVPGTLLGAFFGWAFMVSLDGGSQAEDWLLVLLPALLFLIVGFLNWTAGAWAARQSLRRMISN